MDLATICALPNFFFVRTGYAGRALRKLLTMCEIQASSSGNFFISIEDLKFEEYITAIVHLFLKVHEENNSPVSRAFCLLFSQLKLQGSKSLSALCPPVSGRDEHQDLSSTIKATLAASSGVAPSTKEPGSTNLPSLMTAAPVDLTSHVVGVHQNQPVGQESLILDQQAMPATNPGFQLDLPSWLQTDSKNTTMSDVDVLGFFDQGFGFDDLEMYNFDDISF